MSKARSRGRALARTQSLADVLESRAGLQIGFVQQVADSPSANDCGHGFFHSMNSRLPATGSSYEGGFGKQ